MGFPGDQQQPGGWGPPQPPQSPYGPAADEAADGGSGSKRGTRGKSPYDDSPYGGPPQEGSPYGGGPQEPPSYGSGEGSPYGGGPQEPPSYGSGEGYPPYGGGSPEQPPYGGSSFGGSQEGPPYEPYGDRSGFGGYGDEPPYSDSDSDGDDFRSGPDRKKLIIGAAIVAGVVVVGGGAALALTSGGGDPKPKPTTGSQAAAAPKASATPTPTPTPTGKGDRLRSRTTDPKLLTLNEIFKAHTFKGSGHKFLMTTRRHELKCSGGVHGTSFRKALTKGGCNQVLRATFTNGTLVGTIGVLNLRTQSAAIAAQKASHPKDAFIVPLPGSGDTAKIGHGLSLTTAQADGHYLIMSWVQYPNGKKISSKYYGAVTSFVRNVTLGSNLRPALNYRSMEGKPS
jgi:hypothetical protein